MCACVWGGRGAEHDRELYCPEKSWVYNFICGESVCGCMEIELQGSG